MKVSIHVLILIYVLLSIFSCAQFVSNDEEEMQTAALKLDKLTKMVEAAVRYDDATLERGERPLLICATAEDEDFFRWLDKRYLMKVDIKAGHAVVLMCTKDGKKGLYEDTNCIEGPDVDLRQRNNACTFTLTESAVGDSCQ